MKKTISLKGYTPVTERLPARYGTYRVMTADRVITTAYFDGKEFEWTKQDAIEYWSERRSKS